MAIRIISGEEIVRVNYLWELEELRPECEEKSPVFEVIDNEKKKCKWTFSLKLEENNLVIDFEFSSACRSVIQYNFQIYDAEEEKEGKSKAYRGWGSGDLMKRQGSLVRNSSLSRIRIFCEIICKFNVGMGEPEIPGCQLIDELNSLFGFKNSKQKRSLLELNFGKHSLEYDQSNTNSMKRKLVEDSICEKEEGFDSPSNFQSNSRGCEDSTNAQINIENALAKALEEHTIGFIGKNIDQILATTSFKELELNNPKLAATLLRVVLNLIYKFKETLDVLKSFLHLQ